MPELLFSLHGPEDGRLAIDRPLLVRVRVEPSVDRENALVLAPAGGRWSDGVSVELSASGSPDKVLLRAQRVAETDGAAVATLGAGQVAGGLWLFSSAGFASLAPGDYQVQVRLAIADGSGWHGAAAGEPIAVTLTSAGSNTAPVQETQRALALAQEAMLAKDWPKAAQALDERLAADPDDIGLLQARTIICLEGGNLFAANVCVSRAWARVMREKWSHPPGDLFVLSQIVSAGAGKTAAAAATKDPLPAWSQLPAAVLAPLADVKSAPAPKK